MFTSSPQSSTASSPIPSHSPNQLGKCDHDDPEDPDPSPLALPPPPCWATQALCDLAWAETELHRLRERQATETQSVNRGVERAILGARNEERRLLERVEQDHRDAQQQLEQLQRENVAAARISQTLMDQRLRKLALLREQITRSGRQAQEHGGPDQNLLLRGVAELLQPWEISLTLKKVSFRPSSQTKAVTFGQISVKPHSLCLPAGGCGPQGQLCSLHSGEVGHRGAAEGRSTPNGAGPIEGVTSPTGRVVRKIRLSARSDEESGEELKLSPPNSSRWPPRHEASDRESSPDDEMDLPNAEAQGEELFLAVPVMLGNGDFEGEEMGYGADNHSRRYCVKNQRRPCMLALVSSRDPSSTPEGGRHTHSKLSERWSLDSHDEGRGRVRQGSPQSQKHCYGNVVSPRMSPREPLASHSCLELVSREGLRSSHSQSSDDQPIGVPVDSGRAPSPADSLDSCYTFIVSSPRDYTTRGSLNHDARLSKSTADLTHKNRPLIIGGNKKHVGIWRGNQSNLASTSTSNNSSPVLSTGPRVSHTAHGETSSRPLQKRNLVGSPCTVSRSLSMSVIDGSCQGKSRGRGERAEMLDPALVEMEEEGGPSSLQPHAGASLIRQFGKQGSGRADLTLPSGVHATPQGQLFVVDCGNARVQVTDPRGNVLQQVTSSTSEGSARRCRNYFDIAVNAKGLIGLSCAAERALLVFSRHGRLLQTFGGSAIVSAKDELDAPRGVTVTRLDEFLVADIRRGTLVALKLDPKTGCRMERTVVTGFHRPYLVSACLVTGLVAVSERGSETGREPCVKVLEPGWNTLRVLGVCSGMGPVLTCPWGICIDGDGNVLVADWGEQHKVLLYPSQGVGRPIISQGLSSPRGLALLPEGHLVVSDSMHHCIKIYQYK